MSNPEEQHHQPERVWDEYEWERFLQQQDHKTERYMELLETYMDHPERDEIIAREMGWTHLLGDTESDWAEGSAAFESFLGEFEGGENGEAAEPADPLEETQTFELHPLYQASFGLTIWIDQLFDDLGEGQNLPASVKLATSCAIASAKLAAALSDDDVDELGMSIAYLKRALKAVHTALDAGAQLQRELHLGAERYNGLKHRLFQVRDGIITLMGEFRAEWRRRYGSA